MSEPSGPPLASLPPIAPLDADACRAVLERQRLCVLALVDGDVPYAVPIYYGFDGAALFLGLAEGRKTAVLDASPQVCLVVTETGPGDAWRSVQVVGRARALVGHEERERGVAALIAHNRRIRHHEAVDAGAAPPGPPQRRHTGGRIVQIDVQRITGRMRPEAASPPPAGEGRMAPPPS